MTMKTILRAFRALDPNHQGFVEGDNLKKLLILGDAFDASEADEMIDEAAEKGSNRITMRILLPCSRVMVAVPS